MEISYVQPGEKITAQGYNSLVDAVGGAGNYSAEGFQNEKSGTTLWNRANLSMKYFNGAWRTMFQVVEATYWKQTERGKWDPPNKTKTLLIDLGSDAEALKANVTVMGEKVENAAVIVGESPSMDAEINDDLYKNASDKKAQWVDLGINPEYTSFIAGDFFKEVKEEGEVDNKKKVTKYYFAVTDKSENDVIDRAKQIFRIQGDYFKLIKRFILSKKGDASIGSDIKNYVQAHTGVLSYSTPTPDMISVDSDISGLMLSSIETLSVEYQISGISGDVKTEVGDVYSFWNFEKAQRISLGEALDKEKSNKDSAPSCRVDVVLRVGRADNSVSAPTMVDYLELSTLVTSCDTDFYNKNPKEMKSTSLQWTSAEKGQPALQLKGFKDEDKSDVPEKYDLIVRETTADEDKVLKYIAPADVFQVDNDISSLHRSSLQKQTDPNDADKKFVQLYNFDNPGDLVLSVDKYTNKLPEGYKLVVRHQKDGEGGNAEVEYCDLSIGVQNMSADSEIENSTKSIEKTDDVLRLYNFGAGNTDLTVTLDKGNPETSSSINVLVREGTELKYAALSIDFANGNLSSDSQVGGIKQKSIEAKHSDGLSTDYFQLYKFDQSSRDVTLSIDNGSRELPAGYSILVRRTTDEGDTVLDYANLSIGLSAEQLSCDDKSTEINPISKKLQLKYFDQDSYNNITLSGGQWFDLSGKQCLVGKNLETGEINYYSFKVDLSSNQICADTACDNCDSNSLDVFYSQQKQANIIKINGFDDKQNEEADAVSADAASYDVLMRHHTAGGAVDTAYLNVAALLSTNVPISCDSQGTTNKKSIAYNTAGELELYNFDKTNTDLIVSHLPSGYTPNTQLILTKNVNNGQLQYARLYTNTRTDTSCETYSKSIEYNENYNAIKINGWNTKANTAASTVSANASNYDVLMRRHKGSYYYTEYMNIAPLLGGGVQRQGKTTDLTVITQVVWDTSTHRIQPKGKKLSFVNGLLSAVSETEFNVDGINTTPWTGE